MFKRDYVFEFTEKEYQDYVKWCKEHGLDDNNVGAIGGNTTLNIISTSLGDIVYACATVNGPTGIKQIKHKIRDVF